MGQVEQKVLEQCYRSRQPVPKGIQEAPELDLGLEFVYSAFWELSSSRPMGWGPGPIPWVVLKDYALFHELDEEETEDFIFLIRRMDQAFLDYHNEQTKNKKPDKK